MAAAGQVAVGSRLRVLVATSFLWRCHIGSRLRALPASWHLRLGSEDDTSTSHRHRSLEAGDEYKKSIAVGGMPDNTAIAWAPETSGSPETQLQDCDGPCCQTIGGATEIEDHTGMDAQLERKQSHQGGCRLRERLMDNSSQVKVSMVRDHGRTLSSPHPVLPGRALDLTPLVTEQNGGPAFVRWRRGWPSGASGRTQPNQGGRRLEISKKDVRSHWYSLAVFDGYRTKDLPANLLQAQRDYFGAHTFLINPEYANDRYPEGQ